MHFLLTFQKVIPISKTRNQLSIMHGLDKSGSSATVSKILHDSETTQGRAVSIFYVDGGGKTW